MAAKNRRQRRSEHVARTQPSVAAPTPFWPRLARYVVKRKLWVGLALAGVHLFLAWLSFFPALHNGGDNAAYLALARSLIERHAYLEIYDPFQPPHTQYPPVFPGILALSILLGFGSWVHFKIIIALFSATAIAFAFFWILRRRRPLLAIGIGGILALSPGVLDLSHWELSDVPFWAFTMAALWAWERLGPRDHKRLAIAIVATTLAYFTRSAGLPLIAAAFAWLLLRRRWRQLAAFGAVIGPLAFLWWLRSQRHGGVDYVSQFWQVNPYDPSEGRINLGSLLERTLVNVVKYVTEHVPMMLSLSTSVLIVVGGIILLGLAVYGWLRRVRRPGVPELFLPPYLALLFLWPAVWSGERFLLPVYPLLLYYAGDGLVRLTRVFRFGNVARAAIPAAATALVIAVGIPGVMLQIEVGRDCSERYRAGDLYACHPPRTWDFFDTSHWLKGRLPDDAVVISRKPRLLWALADRTSIIYPFSTESSEFFAAASRANARYVVLDYMDNATMAYVSPVILRRPQAFCLIRVSDVAGTVVFGILPGAAGMPDREITPDMADNTRFEVCPADYFRNPADRAALMRREGEVR